MSIYFAKNHHLDQKKWKRASKVAKNLFGYGHTFTQIKNSGEDEIFFKSDFIPRDTKIQKHNCMLLWMIIIYGFIRA
jgi:hypothetical protein